VSIPRGIRVPSRTTHLSRVLLERWIFWRFGEYNRACRSGNASTNILNWACRSMNHQIKYVLCMALLRKWISRLVFPDLQTSKILKVVWSSGAQTYCLKIRRVSLSSCPRLCGLVEILCDLPQNEILFEIDWKSPAVACFGIPRVSQGHPRYPRGSIFSWFPWSKTAGPAGELKPWRWVVFHRSAPSVQIEDTWEFNTRKAV